MSVLEDKYLKSKNKETESVKKLKEALLQKENNEKEIKMLRDRARESSDEIKKVHDSYRSKISSLEDNLRIEKRKNEDALSDNIKKLQSLTD